MLACVLFSTKIAHPIQVLSELQQTSATVMEPINSIAPERPGKDVLLFEFTYRYTIDDTATKALQ